MFRTNVKSKFNFILLAVCLAGMILTSSNIFAHPYHVSRTELNWNPKTGNFEVALCLWPADLEKALSRDQGKSIDLDKVENLDEMLKAYIEKKFFIRGIVKSADSKADSADETITPTVRWVGHEKDMKQAWLYFEVVVDKTDVKAEVVSETDKTASAFKPVKANIKTKGNVETEAGNTTEAKKQSHASETKWTVENRAFFELNEDQLNYIQITVGKKSEVAICKTGSERHPITQ